MTAAVFEHGGTLDKFIGDAVMAVWGNVRSQGPAEDAQMAARAALAMRRELRALNERWFAQGIAPFAIGIGINQGDVLGGNIGSQEKADPTVIGDTVNLASRLEGLTRTYGVDIILGPTATELVRDEFHVRSVARVQVKGKIGAGRNRDAHRGAKRWNRPGVSASSRDLRGGVSEISAARISRRRKFFSPAFWNSTLTISSRRCIWSECSNTNRPRRMKSGMRWRYSRRSESRIERHHIVVGHDQRGAIVARRGRNRGAHRRQRSEKPADFANASPFPNRRKEKDMVATMVLAVAAARDLAFLVSMLGLLQIHGPR